MVSQTLWLSDVTQGVTLAGKTAKVHAAPAPEMSVVGEAVNVDNTNTVVGNPVTAVEKSTAAPGGQTAAHYVRPVGRDGFGVISVNGFAGPIGCTAKALDHFSA